MTAILNCSRRSFLKASAVAGGGFVLGVYLPALDRRAGAAQNADAAFAPNAFLRIGADESVTVLINHSEMGQGTFTAMSMLVAEELDADWSKVRAEHAPVDPAYNHTLFGIQMVGGSTSTRTEWDRLRKAGATARAMLVAAAAQEWNVDRAACRTENGHVIHTSSGKRLSYGRLSKIAAGLTPPQDVALKQPKEFRLIGKPTKRLDSGEKANGAGVFGIDVKVPGMLTALLARPPLFGATLKSFNADKAKAIPGVRHVVQIDRGVAVVADGFWPAKLGRDALEMVWDEGPMAVLNTLAQRQEYAQIARQPGNVAKHEGDAARALNGAAKKIEAEYELPYLAHAPMEPLNCVADVRPDRCEIWTGTQFQTGDRDAAVKITGLKPDQVKLHTTLLGGGFGRRAVPDSHFVSEAVNISKAVKAPVKVIWTREDDVRGGWYRPMWHDRITAGLDAQGNPIAWTHTIVGQSIAAGTPFEAMMVKNGVDETSVEGAAELPYAIPNVHVELHSPKTEIPVLWWRSVGHSHTAFVVETFIDELAHAAGKDPAEFRRALYTKHPRHKRVLEHVIEKSGWNSSLPAGHGRGLAVHESFESFVAEVAEVSVRKNGTVHVHRVDCAIDCGPIVNPDTIAAQMEGGVVFGLTAALYGQITFDHGRVQQSNFHDYPMLRLEEMPMVHTHIVPSTDAMGGVGETAVPPIAPAVANALFKVTGKRIRRLPIRPEDLL